MNEYELIESMLDNPPETYRPDLGEHPVQIVGQIIGRDVFEHETWGQSPRFVVRTQDGRVWRWTAMHQVPKSEVRWEETDAKTHAGTFSSLSPDIGDWIGARFGGRQTSAGGSEYEVWTITIIYARHMPTLLGAPAAAVVAPAPAVAPVGGPSGVEVPPRPAPPTEERIPNEPEGEPTITHRQAEELTAMFESFADDGLRKQTKQEFVDMFGKPVNLPAWRYEEALGFIREARSGDVF